MRFQTMGNKENPTVLFFHAMGVAVREQRASGKIPARMLFLYHAAVLIHCHKKLVPVKRRHAQEDTLV